MEKRRILAVAAATAVLVTGTLVVGSSTALANDIVNGDFATGNGAGWNIYGGAFAVEDGFGCLSVPAGVGPYGAAFQQRVRLEPATDYVLSFDAKVPTGTATSVTAVVQLPRDPYTGYLTPQAIAAQLGPDPTSFEFTFTTPADLPPAELADPDGPNASLEFQHTASGADAYQLCLTNVDLHPAGSEQVVNGGFDDGTAGWTSMYPNASVIDGWGCVDVPAGTGAYGAGIGQLVSLEPDTDYSLTFTAKLLAGTPGPIRAVVQLPRDPFTQYLPEKAIASELSTEPAEFEFSFTTPSTLPPATAGGDPAGPHAELTIQQNGPSVGAYVLCVDDVSLIGGVAPEPYEPDTGPIVRVNHVGYFQHGPKHATLVSDSATPVAWELLDDSGAVVATGSTAPSGFDESAGLDVHTIDFSSYDVAGDGFTLRAAGEQSFPFEIGVADVYDQMRYDTLDYYYPARSGIAIDGAIAGAAYARPAGHVSSPTAGVANKGDLDVPCQSLDNQTGPSGDNYYGSTWTCPAGYNLDVVGGWYDAGDHGKYVVNGGIAVAQLMGTYERTKTAPTGDPANLADGTLAVPESHNGVPDVLDEARWELTWMMSMQVPPKSGQQLINGQMVDVSGMVHHKIHDEGWTGLPLLPSADAQVRSLHRPSTAATLNFAAVAAQGARLWAPYDSRFATKLLDAGKVAYRAAKANPAIYAPAADGAEGGGPYNDSDVSDEFYWAAAELYLTTGEQTYRSDVLASPLNTADAFPDGGFSWDSMAALARIDLATVPNELPGRAAIRQSVVTAADELLAIQAGEPFGHPYAGDADGNYVWGSNSQILNNMVVLGVAYDLTGGDAYRTAVMQGMDYLLGRNSLGWSYLTGYGEPTHNSMNQHSRWWAAQLDTTLPHPPDGVVSGGPNSLSGTWDPVAQSLFLGQGCAPQRCYVDDIQSWSTNELTVNWNAPMAWVANFLADQGDGGAVTTAPCAVAYDFVRINNRDDLAVVSFTWLGATTRRGVTLSWSYSGAQDVDLALPARITQTGEHVTARLLSPVSIVAPRHTVAFLMVVDRNGLASFAPERFRLDGVNCQTR